MRITKKNLRRLVRESMELDLEIGDVILAGKFKNKRKIVKKIGKDDLGQPTINGMKVLNFRIEKLMPKDKWSKKSKEALEFAEEVNEMKVTKRQLRRIIKEALLREGPDVMNAFQPVIALYDNARDELKLPPEELEKLENQLQSFWENTINAWREDREDPDAWKRR